MHACVIGLPLEIQKRLASALKKEREKQQVMVALILAKIGRSGGYYIHPSTYVATGELVGYLNSLDEYQDGRLIVLPYVDLPDPFRAEIVDAETSGSAVVWAKPGRDEWPVQGSYQDDKKFQDAIFCRIWAELFPPGDLPSANLRMVETLCPRFVIAEGALATCDQIPSYRLAFIQNAGKAMDDYVRRNGVVGPLADFFGSMGLDYAKTGGVKASLSVYRNGVCVYTGSGFDHLKDGDNTSPLAATRFYFHLFELNGAKYAALLHAGVHPSGPIRAAVHL